MTHRILSGLNRSFYALRIRNYRLYWTSQVISLTGSWMQTTAQSWLVLKMTGSPLALGLVNTLQFMPMLLLTMFGGVLADRLLRRRTLVITQSLALIQALIFGLLVATGTVQLWHIYLLAGIQGMISAVDDPMREAFVVEMVGHTDLPGAVALNSMSFSVARAIGPMLAGILVATVGVSSALFLNSLSFIAVIIALLRIKQSTLFGIGPVSTGSVLQNLHEGVTYIRRTPYVLTIFIALAFVGTFGFNFIVMLPLLAKYVNGLDDASFGLLQVFVGVGSILAGLWIAHFKRITINHLLISGTAYSILLGITAFIEPVAISGLLLTMMGALSVLFLAASSTLLQLAVPNHLRGRIMGISVMFTMGSKPISALLIGAVSDHWGTSIAIFVTAVSCMVGVLAALLYRYVYAVETPMFSSTDVPASIASQASSNVG